MTADPIYSVEVAVVCRPDEARGSDAGTAERRILVRYCDVCRRWGAVRSTHLCRRNWKPKLSELLGELVAPGEVTP
jgi:hypothetical protein